MLKLSAIKYYPYDVRRKSLLWLSSIIMLIVMLLTTVGCTCGSRLFDMVIENQTNQILTIYSGEWRVGDVEPDKQIVIEDLVIDFGKYPITAKNTEGEIVFSEIYSFTTNLERLDSRTYKAVIPPLQNN